MTTKIAYFPTDFERVKTYGTNNTLIGLTTGPSKTQAMTQAEDMTLLGIPVVGKLELPPETMDYPDQASTDLLTQIGYNKEHFPDDNMRRDLRIAVRENGLSRLSVVPLEDMMEETYMKSAQYKRLKRISEQIDTFSKDHGYDYDSIVQDPEDMHDAEDLAQHLGDILKSIEDNRRLCGLTKDEEKIYHMGRLLFFGYGSEVFGAKARMYAKKGKASKTDKTTGNYEKKAIEAFIRYNLCSGQLQGEVVRMMADEGLDIAEIIEIGDDEISRMYDDGISLETIALTGQEHMGNRKLIRTPEEFISEGIAGILAYDILNG